jgi:hypothetical protein
LQDFLAGVIDPLIAGGRIVIARHWQYRPRRKSSFCWYFVSCSISAVDAGDRFAHTYLYRT